MPPNLLPIVATGKSSSAVIAPMVISTIIGPGMRAATRKPRVLCKAKGTMPEGENRRGQKNRPASVVRPRPNA